MVYAFLNIRNTTNKAQVEDLGLDMSSLDAVLYQVQETSGSRPTLTGCNQPCLSTWSRSFVSMPKRRINAHVDMLTYDLGLEILEYINNQ